MCCQVPWPHRKGIFKPEPRIYWFPLERAKETDHVKVYLTYFTNVHLDYRTMSDCLWGVFDSCLGLLG